MSAQVKSKNYTAGDNSLAAVGSNGSIIDLDAEPGGSH